MTKIIAYEDPKGKEEITDFKRDPKGKSQKVLKRKNVKKKGLRKAAEEHKL
ncbi:MAG: hypothetical protein KKB37_17190 [Alphaproteobacteria bacterium]|nr:hypothetical protein [Alphaproteobacteria bacterium]